MAQKFTSLAGISSSRGAFAKSKKKTTPPTVVIVVILIFLSIGGFIWLANQGGEEEVQEEQSVQEDSEVLGEVEEEVDEDVSLLFEDENLESDLFDDSKFTKDAQQIGEEGVSNVKIDKLDQNSTDNYYRLAFTIEGTDQIPLATASIKANSNLISLKIVGVVGDKTGINPGDGASVENSVVSNIFHEVSSEEGVANYSIGIRSITPFYLHALSDPKRVVLDVLEQEVTGVDGQEFQFSSGAQSIEGNASGNVILVNGLNYSDQGSAFRIIWKLGTIGTGTIPNVTGEIVDFEGGKAIKMVVSNVYSDFPAGNNYDQSYSHLIVKGVKGSFASYTSTYYIKLAAVREYKLYYMSAPAQLIVDVKR